MASKNESDILSDIEVILPWEVIETCRNLQKNGTSCFLSVNKEDCTTSQLAVHKLEDNSIKIRITVMVLGTFNENEDDELQQTDVQLTDNLVPSDNIEQIAASGGGDSENLQSTVDVASSSFEDGSPLLRKRSLKGRPRIPNAIDTSRLNKHLTAIWSSKRKKLQKRPVFQTPVKSDEITGVISDNTPIESAASADNSTLNESQASTVIIVKTICANSPQKTVHPASNADNSVLESDELKEDEPPQRASHDIAERLKAKKRRFMSAAADETIPTIRPRVEDYVICELCSEHVLSYVELVAHVRECHDDCTYVRTYLEEIIPLAAQLPVSLPCKACGRTFSGKTALAAHKHECHANGEERESKLSAQRRRVKSKLMVTTKPDLDNGSEEALKSFKCDKCDKVYDSRAKLARHSHIHGDRPFQCPHCCRPFSARDNLQKHIAHVHEKKNSMVTGDQGSNSVETRDNHESSESAEEDGSTPRPKSTQRKLKTPKTKTVEKKTKHDSTAPKTKPAKSPKASSAKAASAKGAKGVGSAAVKVSNAPIDQSAADQFKCNRCSAVFNRTTLLVTHMRYCRLPQSKV